MKVIKLSNDNLSDAMELRRAVFIEEQGISEKDEWCALDGQECATHYVCYEGTKPVGTVRVIDQGGKSKMTRFCVLADHRKKGIGKKLFNAAIKDCSNKKIVLNAQLSAEPFYFSLGFKPIGDYFMDAGIPHIEMEFIKED